MENIGEFIKPELLVLVPVLNFVGLGIKKMFENKAHLIPLILGGLGVALALIWVLASEPISNVQEWCMAVFTAVVQGVLCAGLSVYANQVFKQMGDKGD